jgi:hypothetical protein
MQLRRRLESIKRIHRASDELEERVAELVAQGEALAAQARALEARVRAIETIVRSDELPLAANAA